MGTARPVNSNGETLFIPLSVGEFLDRLSILTLKRSRIIDPLQRENVDAEYSLLQRIYTRKIVLNAETKQLYQELCATNAALWDTEDRLRVLARAQDFGDDFVEAAKDIYQLNDKRYRLKRELNIALASPLVEEKQYGVASLTY